MLLTITRISQSELGTFGVLLQGKTPFALTLERPWLNNEPNVSCIPPGEYICRRVKSPKFGDTFEILGVDRRSHLLFHWGNKLIDTKGCVIVGEEFGIMDGLPVVLSSHRAFAEFKERTAHVDEFMLVIQEVWPRSEAKGSVDV